MRRSKRIRDSKSLTTAKKKAKESRFGTWKLEKTCLIFKHNNQKNSSKIASFDFDGTLVKTKSGRAFAKSSDDFQLWSGSIVKKLKDLMKDGFKIVVFSNQGGIGNGKHTSQEIKDRMNAFMDELGEEVEFCFFCSTEKNRYRKPDTLLWELHEKEYNGNEKIDLKESFYVGDAAGRRNYKSRELKKKKNDHSCDDRKFALNIGIKFYTPDEYFHNEEPYKEFVWKGVDIRGMRKELESRRAPKISDFNLKKTGSEMIIMVGFPASGKSTFVQTVLEPAGYVRINRDTLKTIPKCIKATKEALTQGKSVVIDNTNPDMGSRGKFLDVADDFGITARCFYMNTSRDLALHLNCYREKLTNQKRVPQIAFNMFKSKFKMPTTDEGFKSVKEIEFVPVFKNDDEKETFYKYT